MLVNLREFFDTNKCTAILAILAPTYSTLSMGYLELIFYTMCINEFDEKLGQFILENWCHFLDDWQTPLGKTKTDVNNFLDILNFINCCITFTMVINNKELLFLDILIKRNKNKIRMVINYRNSYMLSSFLKNCKKTNYLL